MEYPKGRVASIDALRGFDMFWIIGGAPLVVRLLSLVNEPLSKAVEVQLEHSAWHGFTFLDLIFPLFLFIVGASLPFSLAKRLERGDSRRDIVIHALKRALILYFLGMVMESGRIDMLGGLRYTGVLHRIAVCYFASTLIVLYFRAAGIALWAASLLVGYWLVMTFTPVPGYGAGVFTQEGNLASFLDRLYLPGALRQELIDNEGILSTFPAIATPLLGALTGFWLKSPFGGGKKTAGLAASGVVLLASGWLWGLVFPINKLLWTSSFVLWTGGLCLLFLAVFYWLIDVRGCRRWAFPFVVIGMNALTIYVAGQLFDFGRIVTVFTYEIRDGFGSALPLFDAASELAVKWLFLWYLYRKNWFLKL